MSADAGAAAPGASSAAAAQADPRPPRAQLLEGTGSTFSDRLRPLVQTLPQPVSALSFAPNSRDLFAASGQTMQQWTVETGAQAAARAPSSALAPPTKPTAMHWCSGGRTLCIGGAVWDLKGERGQPRYLEQQLRFPAEALGPVCLQVGAYYMVRARGSSLELWSPAGILSSTEGPGMGDILHIALTMFPLSVIVQRSCQAVQVWRVMEGGFAFPHITLSWDMPVMFHKDCPIATDTVYAVGAAGPLHRRFAAGKGRVVLVDISRPNIDHTFGGHGAPITCVAIGPGRTLEERTVLSADDRGSVVVWSFVSHTTGPTPLLTLALPGPVSALALTRRALIAVAYSAEAEHKLAIVEFGKNYQNFAGRTICIDNAAGRTGLGRTHFDTAFCDYLQVGNAILSERVLEQEAEIDDLEERIESAAPAAAAADSLPSIADICAAAELAERPAHHCPICLESHKAVTVVPCGHRFGATCLAQAALNSDACPICRTEMACVVQTVEQAPPPTKASVEDCDEADNDDEDSSSDSSGGAAAGSKRPASDSPACKHPRKN